MVSSKKVEYVYGLKETSKSVSELPTEGFIAVDEDWTGRYQNLVFYRFPLDKDEAKKYNLVFLGFCH